MSKNTTESNLLEFTGISNREYGCQRYQPLNVVNVGIILLSCQLYRLLLNRMVMKLQWKTSILLLYPRSWVTVLNGRNGVLTPGTL